jgi:hypothetical protein
VIAPAVVAVTVLVPHCVWTRLRFAPTWFRLPGAGWYIGCTAFRLWARLTLRCPQQVELAFTLGGTVHFPATVCAACPVRERCIASARGRSVHLHPDERLLAEFRARQQTPRGRAKLRERVAVEHTLAHVGYWQGRRARYRGRRKNLFDLRCCAVVDHLHVLSHLPAFRPEQQEAA